MFSFCCYGFLLTVGVAFFMGKLVSKCKLPAILGWLITGMVLGPHAFAVMNDELLNAAWYNTFIHILECALA